MSHPAPHAAHGDHDPFLPAGAKDSHQHHGHVIVSAGTLLFVLGALLFLTLLTVGAAEAEKWIAGTFNLFIPAWVNVLVALSIATVKTTLVVMYFMQLRYDNPLNTMIFIFTMITVVFFLGFTMLDLGNRDSLDRFKARQIIPGGTGLNISVLDDPAVKKAGVSTAGLPITEIARNAAKVPGSPTAHLLSKYDSHKDAQRSSANRSRPVRAVTLPGFAPAKPEPGHDDPGDAH